jgi:hypothetical protein
MKRAEKRPTAPQGAPDKRLGRPILETLEQAKALNRRRIDDLVDREPEIAATLEACSLDAPCCLIVCAVCSRRFRFRFIRKLLRTARAYEGVHQWATIHLETFTVGTLANANIKRAHNRLRKRLERCGFVRSILVGCAEVGWDEKRRTWILHVHLLAIGVPGEAWTKLRAILRSSETAIPLKVQPLRDVERQVSYICKFTTYHRPLGRDGAGRSRAVPLPSARLAELAAFWSRHRHEDFPFLFGARRRGGRIGVEA